MHVKLEPKTLRESVFMFSSKKTKTNQNIVLDTDTGSWWCGAAFQDWQSYVVSYYSLKCYHNTYYQLWMNYVSHHSPHSL